MSERLPAPQENIVEVASFSDSCEIPEGAEPKGIYYDAYSPTDTSFVYELNGVYYKFPVDPTNQ